MTGKPGWRGRRDLGHFVFAVLSKTSKLDYMKTYDDSASLPAPRVSEMATISATDLKNATADVFDQVASRHAVAITRHDRPRAVLLSVEQYEALAGQRPAWLEKVYAECQEMFQKMQEPEQRAAAERLFQATPEELADAAVRGAQLQKYK